MTNEAFPETADVARVICREQGWTLRTFWTSHAQPGWYASVMEPRRVDMILGRSFDVAGFVATKDEAIVLAVQQAVVKSGLTTAPQEAQS